MNDNQKKQKEEAREKSLRDSYCIDATGQKSKKPMDEYDYPVVKD